MHEAPISVCMSYAKSSMVEPIGNTRNSPLGVNT